MSALSMGEPLALQRKRPFVTRRAFPWARPTGLFSPEMKSLGLTCLATADRMQPTRSLLLLRPLLLRRCLRARFPLPLFAVRMASGRVLSAVLLLAIATVTVSALIGEHGVPHLLRLRAERQDLGRTAFALLEENARLREDLARLKDDDLYLEELARRQLGLVKPGEIVYRFRSSSRDGRQRR